jgi:alpha-beta hydrolase superfamily lysophospholipase
MHEDEWKIDTPDGFKIYGITNMAADTPSDKCLVLVHGLTGSILNYLQKAASNFFVTKGYDVIRFSLYSFQGDARRLSQATLGTHAADLNQVIDEKASHYSKLFIAGHSYGGPTIMVAQPKNARALSLWDPSFDISNIIGKDLKRRKVDGGYIVDSGVEWFAGPDVINEMTQKYDSEECLSLSKSLSQTPIQVLHAKSDATIYWKEKYSWHSAGHPENERHFIKGADHCFHRGNTLDEVLDLTHQWFEKWS